MVTTLNLERWKKLFTSASAYDHFVKVLRDNQTRGEVMVIRDGDKVVCGAVHCEDAINVIAQREASKRLLGDGGSSHPTGSEVPR